MSPTPAIATPEGLAATVSACRELIEARFPGDVERGAAAMLLDDGVIVTGTAPDVVTPSVEICHETEPFAAAFRLGRTIVASVCLAREAPGRFVVLSPCGVCRERLAWHGPDVRVAVPQPGGDRGDGDDHGDGGDRGEGGDRGDPAWITLGEALPYYWAAVFDDVPWR
ncbi:cytidine deaminase [Prauserella sediminis]|uniref:Cytidine deaminase n=1 Tax=Prauserella sediminis TaxID=577680 RepID=A0A839XQE0_9PSEU|nr:cytidine deaminase [Prauserella sediminis]MBB3663108.1 cytidine deaminase [Prauserella sediminis]